MTFSPRSGRCLVRTENYRQPGLLAIPVVFDLLLLVLTFLKAIRSPVSLKADSIVCVKFLLSLTWLANVKSQMYALVRDELLYVKRRESYIEF